MGGTSSTAADSIDTKVTETKNQNYGLFNVSSESLSSGGINILEITTFLVVFLGALVYVKSVCARRRKKRLAEMSAHLQGISVDYPGQQPVVRVQPNAARVPIMGAQPPIYQPNPGNQIALETYDKYDI